MKYCTKCGTELNDDALFCSSCGTKCESQFDYAFAEEVSTRTNNSNNSKKSEFSTVVKVFMILGLVATCWLIIPLCWTIPMTVHAFNKMNNGEKLTIGFKVCTLIFVSVIAGIFMLADDNL